MLTEPEAATSVAEATAEVKTEVHNVEGRVEVGGSRRRRKLSGCSGIAVLAARGEDSRLGWVGWRVSRDEEDNGYSVRRRYSGGRWFKKKEAIRSRSNS